MSKSSEYLLRFKEVAKSWFADAKFVQTNYAFFQSFFERENLEKLEWPEIQQLGAHLHCFHSVALARAKALGRPNHPIDHYRKSFLFLAHGPGDAADRLRKFDTDEQYELKYFGKSAISEIAGYLFAEHFIFANSRDEFAIKQLGLSVEGRDPRDVVNDLQALSRATRPVAEEYLQIVGKQSTLPLNIELDQFFSWIYKTESGTKESGPAPPRAQPKYWVMALGRAGEYWESCYRDGLATMGWDALGDLTAFNSKEGIQQALQELEPDSTSKKNDALACWEFAHVMRPGDIIFSKRGTTTILGYGVVVGDYVHDASKTNHGNVRRVDWRARGEWPVDRDKGLATKTLTDISDYSEQVRLLSEAVGLKPEPEARGYWWLNANPKIWRIADAPKGFEQAYSSHNEAGEKRKKYKYFHEVRPGDPVVGYVTSPQQEVVAFCEITKAIHQSENGEAIGFAKVETIANPVPYEVLERDPRLAGSEPLASHQGSLFKLTRQQFEAIRDLAAGSPPPKTDTLPYTREDALNELFLSEEQFDGMLRALREKKNLVLQGAPGVGKTFVAKRLAFALMGQKASDRLRMIQFHQSYSYEDFVQGYRPTADGSFELRNGLLYQFCELAKREELLGKEYVLVIDEINRGNLSKILGEVMMLIEPDKRGAEHALQLAYGDGTSGTFYIPSNLYVIGTMNTADRSLAMVDYALRRRFRFVTLLPEYESKKFRSRVLDAGARPDLVDRIETRMRALNERIASDTKNLGPGYVVGHSYFCPLPGVKPDMDWYRRVVEDEIVPLIQEYWFDNDDTVKDQRALLLD